MNDFESRIKHFMRERVTRKPRSWTDDQLAKALRCVWQRKMKVAGASRKFGIPYSTFHRYVGSENNTIVGMKQLKEEFLIKEGNSSDITCGDIIDNNHPSTGTNEHKIPDTPLLSTHAKNGSCEPTPHVRVEDRTLSEPLTHGNISSNNIPSTEKNEQSIPEFSLLSPHTMLVSSMTQVMQQPMFTPPNPSAPTNFYPNSTGCLEFVSLVHSLQQSDKTYCDVTSEVSNGFSHHNVVDSTKVNWDDVDNQQKIPQPSSHDVVSPPGFNPPNPSVPSNIYPNFVRTPQPIRLAHSLPQSPSPHNIKANWNDVNNELKIPEPCSSLSPQTMFMSNVVSPPGFNPPSPLVPSDFYPNFVRIPQPVRLTRTLPQFETNHRDIVGSGGGDVPFDDIWHDGWRWHHCSTPEDFLDGRRLFRL